MKLTPLLTTTLCVSALTMGCVSTQVEPTPEPVASKPTAAPEAPQPYVMRDVPQVNDRRSAYDPRNTHPEVEPDVGNSITAAPEPASNAYTYDYDDEPAAPLKANQSIYVPFPQAHGNAPKPNLKASLQPDPTAASDAAIQLRQDYGQLSADVATAQFCQSHASRNKARDRLVTLSQIRASALATGTDAYQAAGAYHGYLIGVRAAFNHYNAFLLNSARNKMCASAAGSVEKRLLLKAPSGTNNITEADVAVGKAVLNTLPSSSTGTYPAHIAVANSCNPDNKDNQVALASVQSEMLQNVDAELNAQQASPEARIWTRAAAIAQFTGIADAQGYFGSGQDADGRRGMCEKAQKYVSAYLANAENQ